MKTAITVLQEMMVKLSQVPEYECISQSGPQHQAMFEYQCSALGAVVRASARSKKEAKQEAARLMLRQLAASGHIVPPPYGLHDGAQMSSDTRNPCVEGGASGTGASGASTAGPGAHTYVALLQELCAEYGLAGPEYELVADTGPPHLRHFTMAARVARLERRATSTTKKAARQLAAEQLYHYLRENLARLTADFVEEEALSRAHERAMDRYTELRDDCRRPHLGQKIVDYHLGLTDRIDADSRGEALRWLRTADGGGDAQAALEGALQALRLRAAPAQLPAAPPAPALHVLAVPAASPPLAFAGRSPAQAAAHAVRYLRRALARPPAAADSEPAT